MTTTVEQILRTTTFREIDVDLLLDPARETWVAFDPVVGYVPANVTMRDGIDFSWSNYAYAAQGYRRLVNWPDKPCRITTYGDSFTQCQQVSDDETWQERLAAHFGEPIKNYGSGGYGVFQAVKRLYQAEDTEDGGEYVILNIFDDDHIRNLDAARWIRTAWNEKERPADKAYPLHGLPWSHLRFDVKTATWQEIPGACKNEDDLRALCDPERFVQTFKDDQIVRLFALKEGADLGVSEFETLAEAFGIKVNLRDPATRDADLERLHRVYGFKSTEFLLEELLPWLEKRNKKLLILLSYSIGSLGQSLSGNGRFDDYFIEYLERMKYPYVDATAKHQRDYKDFNLDINAYIARYYVGAAGAAVFGHYTPTGNHFFAFSIKDDLVKWLDPAPPNYKPE